jgi:RNA polymerase primary sigma factor
MARRRSPSAPARHPIIFLTADEERALAARVAAGGPDGLAARNELVERNLPYARHLARRWAASGRDFEDVLSLAYMGLIRAAEEFEPMRGRFTTCADQWIREAVQRGLRREGSLVRVPCGLHDLRGMVARGEVDLAALPPGQVRRLAAAGRALRVRAGGRPAEDGPDPAAVLAASPAEDRPFGPDELARLGPLLDRLPARERAVLAARFGLDDEPPRTLEEVGAGLGCTKEWVRQLEARALARLRAMAGAVPGAGVRSGAGASTEGPAMDGDANGVVADAKPGPGPRLMGQDLTEDDRAAILRLHAAEPGLTAARIATRLAGLTGRKFDGRAVRGVLYAVDDPPPPPPPPPPSRARPASPPVPAPVVPVPVPRYDPPPPAGSDDDDPELAALVVICRVLRGLEPGQVDRVLRYAGERAKGST